MGSTMHCHSNIYINWLGVIDIVPLDLLLSQPLKAPFSYERDHQIILTIPGSYDQTLPNVHIKLLGNMCFKVLKDLIQT